MILILGGYMKGHLIAPLRKAAKDRKGFLIVILISDIQWVYQQLLLTSTMVELWGLPAFYMQKNLDFLLLLENRWLSADMWSASLCFSDYGTTGPYDCGQTNTLCWCAATTVCILKQYIFDCALASFLHSLPKCLLLTATRGQLLAWMDLCSDPVWLLWFPAGHHKSDCLTGKYTEMKFMHQTVLGDMLYLMGFP